MFISVTLKIDQFCFNGTSIFHPCINYERMYGVIGMMLFVN